MTLVRCIAMWLLQKVTKEWQLSLRRWEVWKEKKVKVLQNIAPTFATGFPREKIQLTDFWKLKLIQSCGPSSKFDPFDPHLSLASKLGMLVWIRETRVIISCLLKRQRKSLWYQPCVWYRCLDVSGIQIKCIYVLQNTTFIEKANIISLKYIK